MSNDIVDHILISGLIVLIVLAFQRWFWVLVFAIGALASLFALIASIIHFQIVAALGFFFLMVVLRGIAIAISEG